VPSTEVYDIHKSTTRAAQHLQYLLDKQSHGPFIIQTNPLLNHANPMHPCVL